MSDKRKILNKIGSVIFLFIALVLSLAVFCLFLFVVGILVGFPMMLMGSKYWFNVWIAYDESWNAALRGLPNETVSSRLGKSIHYGLTPVFFTRRIDKFVSRCLDRVDTDHVRKSIIWEVGETIPGTKGK